ncbi:efflux RND transporter permease subunit [Pseudoalteromonas xiamenensis]
MINRIISWALSNRAIVCIVLAVLLAACAIVIPKINLDAFPDVTNVQVSVNTEAPGLAAEEVEQLITYPIETVMYALPDVESVRSISKTGLSGVTIVFKENVDIYFARQLVFERLEQAKGSLPGTISAPEIGPNTSGLGQIYQYRLDADANSGIDNMTLRSLNDWVVKLLLMPIDGITDVLSFGGEVKQLSVELNPEQLNAFGLTQQDVMKAIEENNLNVGGWYLNRGEEQLAIRGFGWIRSESAIQDIAQLPVKYREGRIVKVADVASVKFAGEERQGAVTMSVKDDNQRVIPKGEIVTGIILKRLGSNTNETINAINQRVEQINQALPRGVTFQVIYDQSQLVKKAIDTVVFALLLAFVFIIIVLLLFLMDFRATLLVLISIPISIALALFVMTLLGLSANLMSLGGLAIAIGMLVDGSVVMVENMVKRLRENQKDTSRCAPETIRLAACEVAKPVFFASSIILVVFLPLFSFEGVEAKLFEPMAVSIMLAILASMLVAIVVVPAIASKILSRKTNERQNLLLNVLEKNYLRLLTRAVRSSKIVLVGMLGIVFSTLLVIPQLGSEFVPELEEGTINLRVTLAPSASLDTALTLAPKLENVLLAFEQVDYAVSRIGRAEIGGDPEPVNNIEVFLSLTPHETWPKGLTRQLLQQQMAKQLEQFPGVLLNFSQPIATRVDELLSGVKSQLAIKITGEDLEKLQLLGTQLEQRIKTIEGTADVALEQLGGEAQLLIEPNRTALSNYGLAVKDLMDIVEKGIGGVTTGQIFEGNARYDIRVRLEKSFRNSISAIEALPIQTPSGYWVRVKDVATVAYATGPIQIRRDDVQRRVVIQANVLGRDMGSVVNEIKKTIEQSNLLPAGYSFSIGGQFENQQRAQKRLQILIPVSILLVAVLLFITFQSLKQTLLILVNVPLATAGGVISLYAFNQFLSVPTAIGFITLFGIAVLNGVVLIDSINQRMKSGTSVQEAVIHGALSRFRPVLMTALTTAMGLLPMLMSTGVGAEIQKPLATVIVGGIITSTLLTLIVLPVLVVMTTKTTD